MTIDEATERIYRHAGFQLDTGDVGLGELLRPYRREPLDPALADIAQALITLHPVLGRPSVPGQLCAALWHLCDSTRTIATRPRSGLRSNKLAPAEELDRLDAWVDAFERFCIRALRGLELAHCLFPIIERLADGSFESAAPYQRLLPALRSLEFDDDPDPDDAPNLARAIANLSPQP